MVRFPSSACRSTAQVGSVVEQACRMHQCLARRGFLDGIRILDEKRSNISTESELKFLINDRRFSVSFNRYRQIQFSIGNDNFCVDFPTVN